MVVGSTVVNEPGRPKTAVIWGKAGVPRLLLSAAGIDETSAHDINNIGEVVGSRGSLSAIYERWKAERQPSPKLEIEWDKFIRRFQELHGDLPLAAITRRQASAFKDALLKMPTRPTKALRKKPIREIMAAVSDDPNVPKLTAASVKKYLGAVQSVLSWALDNGFIETNPASGIKVHDPRGQQEAGIAYLDNNTLDEGKRLKNLGSRRKVPLHSELVRLGFLKYAKGRAKAGADALLFPALRLETTGTRTGNWSKWWGRYARQHGPKDRRKVFHSFRHTFKDACRAAEIEEPIFDALQGHAGARVSRGYGEGYPLRVLAAAVEKIRYPGVVLPARE